MYAKEFRRIENLDTRQALSQSLGCIAMPGRQREQVVIPAHDICRLSGNGQFNELFVPRISRELET
jgi:hypothetical protein